MYLGPISRKPICLDCGKDLSACKCLMPPREHKIELEGITPERLYMKICIATVQADMKGEITWLTLDGRRTAVIAPASARGSDDSVK